jgi:hypothetical protein
LIEFFNNIDPLQTFGPAYEIETPNNARTAFHDFVAGAWSAVASIVSEGLLRRKLVKNVLTLWHCSILHFNRAETPKPKRLALNGAGYGRKS